MTYESAKYLARRAYLMGRLTRSATALWAPLLVGMLALWAQVDGGLVCFAVLGSTAWLFGSHLISHRLGDASYAGALIGIVPFGAGALAPKLGHACGSSLCYDICLGACLLGGFVGGFLVMRYATRTGRRASLLAVAAPLMITSGSLGCGCVGTAGIGTMVTGVVLGALLAARR